MSRNISLIMKSKKIEIGSGAFFKNFPDYVEKDRDFLVLCEKELIPGKLIINMRKDKDDVFFMWNCGKDELIRRHSGFTFSPMAAGKFLVPEVIQELGIQISDLEILRNVVERLDDKHSYEKVIYNSYIENGNTNLTPEQLEKAWEEYKKWRPDIYETRK